MVLTEDIMVVSNKGWVENTIVQDSGCLYIESAGRASRTTVSSAGGIGGFYVYTDGWAISTTISSGGALWLSGGLVESTEVLGNGYFNIFSGSATSTTIQYGALLLYDGKATDIQLNRGGLMVVSGGTADNAVVSGSMYLRGGQLNSATVGLEGLMTVSGGTANHTEVVNGKVFLYAGAMNSTAIRKCGDVQFLDGGAAYDTVIDTDGRMVVKSGTAHRTTLNSGGSMDVSSLGVANRTTVNNGGWLSVGLGGVASSATVSSGGTMSLQSGAVGNDIRVYESGKLSLAECSLNRVTVNSGGSAILYYKKVDASKVFIDGGEIQVLDSGMMSQSVASDYLTVMNSGSLVISAGGTVDGAIVRDHGHVTVKLNAVFANATVINADVTAEYSAKVSGLTLSSGGVLYGSSSEQGLLGAKIQDVTVSSGGILNVSGAKFQDVTVSSGGSVTGVLRNASGLVFAGGTLDLNIAKASVQSASLVDSASYAAIKSGTYDVTLTVANKQLNGTYILIRDATDFNTTVTVKFGANTLGTLTVGGGPTDVGNITCDLKLNDFGTLVVVVTNGAIPDPIYSGATLTEERKDITSGMSAIDVTVSSGGILAICSGGEASNTTVYYRGEFMVESKGDLIGATVRYGGKATLYEDASAHDVVVAGGTLVVESGAFIFQTSKGKTVTSNIIVSDGGKLNVNGGWVEGALVSGGQAVIESDGSMYYASVANGTVQVKDGAYAGMTILNGGVVSVESGGTAACTVSSGGIIRLEDGCELNNSLRVYEGGVVTGVMHDLYEVRMYGGTLDFDISEAAPSGEYIVDMDTIFNADQGMFCTLTVDGSQAYGTYNLMEYAWGYDSIITYSDPLTVKNTAGSELGTLAVGETAEIDGATYTLNLSDDYHLTVTISEGAPTPPPPTPTPTPGDKSFFTGDFNGDLFDTLAVQSGSTVTIYQNGEAWGLGLTLDTGWSVVGTGDFNGDNIDDFLRVNTEGYVVGEMSNGNGTFTPQVLNLKNAGWDILGTGDFNGNGTDDVLIANPTGASETVGLLGYWESGVSWTLINGYSPEWTMVSTGDFNGDGKCDMLWKNSFVGDGGLTYNAYCTWIVEDPVDWRMVSVANPDEWNFLCSGDFDGNGSHDIAMINDVGVVGIWGVTDGYLSSWSILSAVTNEWTLAGVADFNADGTDDIAWNNTDTGLTGYWQINDKQLTTWANIATIG
ncbi:MAG: AIDA repeat-containing protein [Lentisphaeria bacterium]|nr:AIDA repeat-containing protein [Lentisphaeria bacterium]